MTDSSARRLQPTVSREQAATIVRRLVGQGTVRAELHHHPFWCVELTVERRPSAVGTAVRRLRGAPAPQPERSQLTVFVDARGGTSFIADVPLTGRAVPCEGPLAQPPAADVAERARSLAAAALRRRFRLGMDFALHPHPPQPVLKPNWLIHHTGPRTDSAFLIDGFDGSHYPVHYSRHD